MEIFLYKKIANVSSANECHKTDTSSRARKTEHMRSRQNVPGLSKIASKPWNRMAYGTVTTSCTVHEYTLYTLYTLTCCVFLSFLTIYFFLFSLRFQWDLVCDRKHLKAMTQTVYMGGLLVGSVAFSALSDHVGRKIVAFLSIFFLVSIAGRKDANLASENSRH